MRTIKETLLVSLNINKSEQQAIENLMNSDGNDGKDSTGKSFSILGKFLWNANNSDKIPSEFRFLFASLYGTILVIDRITFIIFTMDANPSLIDPRDKRKKLDRKEFISDLSTLFFGLQETLIRNFAVT